METNTKIAIIVVVVGFILAVAFIFWAKKELANMTFKK